MSKQHLNLKASYASITAALIIITIKIYAWYITDSTIILASLSDSLLDITTSIINFLAIRYALKPADNEHRFGHGKAEDLAVFTQAAFFIVSCIFVIIIAIKKIIYPEVIEHQTTGIIVMICSTLITMGLVSYQSYVVKNTGSKVVKADRLHYAMDLLMNVGIIVSLYLSKKFGQILDPIFGILIALYISHHAFDLFKQSFHNLMDHEFHEDEKAKIYQILNENSKIKGFHDLKTRYGGRDAFIQFHIELDQNMTLKDSHKIVEELENEVRKKFQNAEVIIHQDPEGVKEHKQFEK